MLAAHAKDTAPCENCPLIMSECVNKKKTSNNHKLTLLNTRFKDRYGELIQGLHLFMFLYLLGNKHFVCR